MKDFDEIFRAALKAATSERGAKSKLARDTGLSSPFIYRMLKGSQYGSEATRRKIAAALGYPGSRYEEFLNIGRRELGFAVDYEISSGAVNNGEGGSDEKWREKYLAELQAHDETLNALLTARKKIAEFEKLSADGERPPKKAR